MLLVNLEQTSSCKLSQTTNCIHCFCEMLLVFAKIYLQVFIYSKTCCKYKVSDFPEYQNIPLFSADLSLWNITAEKKCGLASVFLVTCAVCGAEDVVKTSSEHRSSQRGPLTQDVNSRAVLGCLHTGIGETHLNNLLYIKYSPYKASNFLE